SSSGMSLKVTSNLLSTQRWMACCVASLSMALVQRVVHGVGAGGGMLAVAAVGFAAAAGAGALWRRGGLLVAFDLAQWHRDGGATLQHHLHRFARHIHAYHAARTAGRVDDLVVVGHFGLGGDVVVVLIGQ